MRVKVSVPTADRMSAFRQVWDLNEAQTSGREIGACCPPYCGWRRKTLRPCVCYHTDVKEQVAFAVALMDSREAGPRRRALLLANRHMPL